MLPHVSSSRYPPAYHGSDPSDSIDMDSPQHAPPVGDYAEPVHADDLEHIADNPAASASQLSIPAAPPNFSPFFALVDDATSGEHYHPTVHYVFADDDEDLVTAASLKALEQRHSRGSSLDRDLGEAADSRRDRPTTKAEAGGDDGEGQVDDGPLPQPKAGTREQYLIIDLASDGQTVVSARSLSQSWQVTGATVTPAPILGADVADGQDGADGDDNAVAGGGMMLRVSGTGLPHKQEGLPSGTQLLRGIRERGGGDLVKGMEDLVDSMWKEMSILEKVTGADQEDDT